MTFLPIVERELRAASRRPASYWYRCASVGTAILFAAFIYLNAASYLPMAAMGRELFGAISVVAFLYCLVAGLRFTADCLSEEKREGTLGLLFLTDLKGYDVVAGKLVATSLNGCYGLLAILPVLAISILMGGVTSAEMGRMALALLNTFFLSLCVGMLMSAFFTSALKSFAGSFCALVLAPAGMAWGMGVLLFAQKKIWLVFTLAILFPATSAFLAAGARLVPNGANIYWESLAAIHVLAWACLLMSCILVPRSWQDRPAVPHAQRGGIWRRLDSGNSRRDFRKSLLDVNAAYWLSARDRFLPVLVWLSLLVLGGLWLIGLSKTGYRWLEDAFFGTVMTVNFVIKLWVASQAGRRLGQDRKSGALELMLSTRLSIKEILWGQVLAMSRLFLVPLIMLVLAELGYLLYVIRHNELGSDDLTGLCASGLTFIVFLVLDCVALTLVAMWTGLTAKNPNRTMGLAARKILLFPLLFGYAPLFLYLIFANLNVPPDWPVWLEVYIVSGLAADLYFGATSWWKLVNRFREVATLRFTPETSFWRKLFSVGTDSGTVY